MQTTIRSKRFDFGQFKVAALAVGIAASVAVGVIAYSQTRDDAPAVSASRPAARISAEQLQFIEQNTQLPEAAPGKANARYDDLEVLPQAHPATPTDGLIDPNMLPDVDARTNVLDQEYYWLLDQNVLPGDDVRPSVMTREDYWLLDQNVLPGDDAPMPPNGTDGQPY